MIKAIKLLVYPVTDIEKATALYTKLLGVEPYVSSPYYVGYKVNDIEVGLDPHGAVSAGALNYLDVEDINHSIEDYKAAGAELVDGPKDVGGGLKVAKIKDVDGNMIGLRQ